jgi:hypothetical protein
VVSGGHAQRPSLLATHITLFTELPLRALERPQVDRHEETLEVLVSECLCKILLLVSASDSNSFGSNPA